MSDVPTHAEARWRHRAWESSYRKPRPLGGSSRGPGRRGCLPVVREGHDPDSIMAALAGMENYAGAGRAMTKAMPKDAPAPNSGACEADPELAAARSVIARCWNAKGGNFRWHR